MNRFEKVYDGNLDKISKEYLEKFKRKEKDYSNVGTNGSGGNNGNNSNNGNNMNSSSNVNVLSNSNNLTGIIETTNLHLYLFNININSFLQIKKTKTNS